MYIQYTCFGVIIFSLTGCRSDYQPPATRFLQQEEDEEDVNTSNGSSPPQDCCRVGLVSIAMAGSYHVEAGFFLNLPPDTTPQHFCLNATSALACVQPPPPAANARKGDSCISPTPHKRKYNNPKTSVPYVHVYQNKKDKPWLATHRDVTSS